MLGVDTRGIDEILLEMGVLKIVDLKKAWDIQRESNKNIEDVLLELGLVSQKDIMHANAVKMGIPFVDLSTYQISDSSVPLLITRNIANRYKVIPIEKENGVLTVAMSDPTDIFCIDDIRLATALEIKPVLADVKEIERLIVEYFGEEKKPQESKLKAENEEQNKKEELLKMEEELLGREIYNNIKADVETREPEFDLASKGFDQNTYNESGIFKDKIGNILVRAGVITQDQLENALSIQKKSGGLIGQILVKQGYIDRRSLYEFLQKQMGVEYVDIEGIEIDEDIIGLVSPNLAKTHKVIPIEKVDGNLKVAMSDPMNIFSIDDLRLTTGLEIIPCLADEEQISAQLEKYYGKASRKTSAKEIEQKVADLDEEIKKVNEKIAVEITQTEDEDTTIDISDLENAPIVKMVNIIFQKAVATRASDIHIEPQEDCVLIRFRIDGQLVEIMRYDRKILSSIVARIKIISGLNIAEKRIPQDGRIGIKIDDREYDMRVSVLPTMFGEKVVIRIADKEGFNVSKKELGFFEDDLEKFDQIISSPYGIILVTGPTGSGKSTTLYTALRELCKPNVNILTVEDPVESTIKGINQVQVNVKAGLTFATALRAFLRQDPDIIMVGEIRDSETAEIAIRAAITGHLVFSTLHTNDAASSVTRMIDMGIEPFLLSSALVGLIAQRLVRRLCPHCKEAFQPDKNEREILGLKDDEEVTIYRAKGCDECNNTGYKGRIAVYEILTVNREIKELISKNVSSDVIKDAAIKMGMKTLRMNCTRLVKEGITTIDEMLRIAYSID
ncbi:MAG TPA: type II secretion system protein E [Hungateiclostridium thermocellum]|uniref:Type II secretion system protein E n=2 Tax=Acetivibrio thermocellus TaxID=1515 RepID=A3DEG0_ACET2|nr:ATPase, T2SS/T4P/T4SS family [Acetivibrio thermocellus]ABN52339.1 type II secretion system protein E [Acetivibrio thermocellus ATCC 27405]ADU74170.1 type II secretion system protein E [Acetivibrio thermocellus DSM 1313]ALX08113.1 type II secretion system protein E [Acetivibrio thermocellus AD2]ANV75860.1 type II secretion system protein E [Acetivibrio thermocellus DSM 2360]EIC05863.1 type II secretion system protein E [Acetivibrio thermocellus YS]